MEFYSKWIQKLTFRFFTTPYCTNQSKEAPVGKAKPELKKLVHLQFSTCGLKSTSYFVFGS